MDRFELLVEAHRPAMKAVLARLVELLRTHDVRYVIGGANALSLYVDPRNFAVAHPREAIILGTKLKAASPEALLWLYLVSTKEQNHVDALNLLRVRRDLDISLVRKQIERHQPELIARLDTLLNTAREPVPSYDESRARRR